MPNPKKRGRPKKINPEDPTIQLPLKPTIEKLAQYGLKDTEIADIIDICEKTLNNLKADPGFLQSLKTGKEKADNYVVGSLFHRAIGYTHPEVQLFCYQGKIVQKEIMKHYPPDPTAAIFWLKNRRPKEWREKNDGESLVQNRIFLVSPGKEGTIGITNESIKNRVDAVAV